MFTWSLRIGLFSLLFASIPAWAGNYPLIEGTVQNVGVQLPGAFGVQNWCSASDGACGFVWIAESVFVRFRTLFTIIGLLVISIAGIRMLVAQEDDAVAKTKATMSGAISALILVYLIGPFLTAFYGLRGEIFHGGQAAGAGMVNTEVGGFINWATVIIASLSVFMIILSALKTLGKGEDAIASLRKTVFSVLIGILLLFFRGFVAQQFVANPGSPVPAFIVPVLRILSFVLGFMAFVAVAVVIYAGLLMVLSLGNTDQNQKAKGILTRAALGFVLIFVSYALISFVIIP